MVWLLPMLTMRPRSVRPGSIALVMSLAAAAVACRPAEGSNAAANQPAGEPTVNQLSVPLPEAPMDRAAFLNAVRQAASAAASGIDDRQAQRTLEGRQFEVRIRFGCAGPAPALKGAALGWSYDEGDHTLRVRALPTITGEQKAVATLAPEGSEAIEGFWIPRPWLLDARCPAAAAIEPAGADRADQAIPSSPAVGIAEFFTAADARTGRRNNRAYESVSVLEKGQAVGSRGFDLVLSGRLRALAGGKVVNCAVASRDAPPSCVASATFDRVWIEQPETHEIVAEWGRS